MPIYKIKPLIQGGEQQDSKVVFVEELPEQGEFNITYKLPDGSVWVWVEEVVEKEIKVIDHPEQHAEPNTCYNIRYSDIDINKLLNILNKAFKKLETNPFTLYVEEPEILLSDKLDVPTNLHIVWSNKEYNSETEEYSYSYPADTDNCFIYFDFGYCYAFSGTNSANPLNMWFDFRTKEPISREDLILKLKLDYSAEKLAEYGLTFEDFDFLFEDLGEEVSHTEIVEVLEGSYRRLDNETIIANPELPEDAPALSGLQLGDTKYKIEGGSAPVNKPYCLTADIAFSVMGKCLDVDALIDLIASIDDRVLVENSVSVEIPLNNTEDYSQHCLIRIGTSSDTEIVLNEEYYITLPSDTPVGEALRIVKPQIERYIFSKFETSFNTVTVPVINVGAVYYGKSALLSFNQLTSLFKDTTAFKTYDLFEFIYNKSIKVDKLIALIDSVDDTLLDSNSSDIVCPLNNSNPDSSGEHLFAIYGGSGYMSIYGGYSIKLEEDTIRESLLAKREQIERAVITNYNYIVSDYTYPELITDSGDSYPITLEALKELYTND